MAQLHPRLARHASKLLLVLGLLGLLASLVGLPAALADAPAGSSNSLLVQVQGTALATPPALAPATAGELFPFMPQKVAPATTPHASVVHGRGYVAPPFDTSHLNNYPPSSPGLDLVSRWDWRETSKVTRVQDQGACGACYAFATLASMESQSLIRDGTRYDFSENNLIECNYEETGCGGGNIWTTSNRLSTYGTVAESCDPWNEADQACNTGCPAVLVASEVWVLGGNVVPNTDVLKGWLQQYGPLYITMDAGTNDAWGQEFTNYNGSYTLYHPMTSPNLNHAVTLVGWDDGLTHGGGSGAWIVKNSWGTNWGGTCGYGTERGYFTIAYGSAGIGSDPALVRDWRPAASAAKLLYNDEAGLQGGAMGPYGLVRLTPQQNGYATQVEIWTWGPSTVDVAIYDTFNGQAASGLLWQKQGVSLQHAGYHSVAIDGSVAVQAGNDVNVQVRFNTPGDNYPVPIDSVGPVSTNHSFISASGGAGSWSDAGALGQPYDIGIRLRIGSGGVTPTPTRTLSPTATHTPHPGTLTPTNTPRPSTGKRLWLPLMLRQWTTVTWPTPTHTPGPSTPTYTPPPPTPTPTVDAQSVYILANHKGYRDYDGGLHVVGEVKNDSGGYVSMLRVTAHIYDASETWLASESAYTPLDNLPPGWRTCFHISLDPIADASYYVLGPLEYWTEGEASPELAFTDHGGNYDSDSGWYVLMGEVSNEEGQSVEWVKVVGALYDEDYVVLGCDFCYVDSVDLGPGESSTFGLTYTDIDYGGVDGYLLQAEAQWP